MQLHSICLKDVDQNVLTCCPRCHANANSHTFDNQTTLIIRTCVINYTVFLICVIIFSFITDQDPGPRRSVGPDGTTLTIRSVYKSGPQGQSDLMVVQCNSSNVHGYIFASGYLNIIGRSSSTVWASYQIRNFAGCACAGNAGEVFPAIAG